MPDGIPPAAPARAPVKTAAALAACAAACLAAAVTHLKTDEGKRNVDYRDLDGIPTACYGHTGAGVVIGTRRTDAACDALLSADAQVRLKGVFRCVPDLAAHPAIWAASTRMAYNTGVPAFCGSSTARAFNAGQWRAGCDAMLAWDKATVRGAKVEIPGLLARRQRERAQCLAGVAA